MDTSAVSYKNYRFPPQIIARAVWLYFRFPLSLRLVEEMLLERGIIVSYETIRRWGRKFGSAYVKRLRRKKSSLKDVWHLDEVVLSIAGRKHWLWRAVDQNGYVLDEIVQARRDTKAAKRLLVRLLKKQGLTPKRIVTDKLRSYGAANAGSHAYRRTLIAQRAEQSRGEFPPATAKARTDDARLSIRRRIAAFHLGLFGNRKSLRPVEQEALCLSHTHSSNPRNGAVEGCDRRGGLILTASPSPDFWQTT